MLRKVLIIQTIIWSYKFKYEITSIFGYELHKNQVKVTLPASPCKFVAKLRLDLQFLNASLFLLSHWNEVLYKIVFNQISNLLFSHWMLITGVQNSKGPGITKYMYAWAKSGTRPGELMALAVVIEGRLSGHLSTASHPQLIHWKDNTFILV